MKTDEIFFVRHGVTAWTLSKQHTGRTDIPLDPSGFQEIEAALPFLRSNNFDLVLTSPSLRARQTAELLGFPLAILDEDLHEWDYGDYEGKTTEEIHEQRPRWDLFLDGCPQGECLQDLVERTDRVLRRLRGKVLLFVSGHSGRVLIARWLQIDPLCARHFPLRTAGVGKLGWERTTPVLSFFNC